MDINEHLGRKRVSLARAARVACSAVRCVHRTLTRGYDQSLIAARFPQRHDALPA